MKKLNEERDRLEGEHGKTREGEEGDDDHNFRNFNKDEYFDEREHAQMINTNMGILSRFH